MDESHTTLECVGVVMMCSGTMQWYVQGWREGVVAVGSGGDWYMYAVMLMEMLRPLQLQVERVCHRHLGRMCASEAQE